MIMNVVVLKGNQLKTRVKDEHIKVTQDACNKLKSIAWLYETGDASLYQKAKNRKGIWDYTISGWTFSTTSITQSFFDDIVKKHPDWPIIGRANQPFMALAGVKFSIFKLTNDLEACLIPLPLPFSTNLEGMPSFYQISVSEKKKAGIYIGSKSSVTAVADLMFGQGAICDNSLFNKWQLDTDPGHLTVKVNGWALEISCHLNHPLHYLIAPEQKYRWQGVYLLGNKITIPWMGKINTTRKFWPELKNKIQSYGIEIEGDDPNDSLHTSALFDSSRVHGWDTPAPNGYLLHAYQKEGARFCAERGMRALIGDEMGVGKTVQAIAAAEAVNAAKILIICPVNARYVWDREIKGWGGRGGIQHITSQLDEMDGNCRWHIVTYEQITTKAQSWKFNNASEVKAFVTAFPKHELVSQLKLIEKYPKKASFDKWLDAVPIFADPKQILAWKKMMQRLKEQLLEQFLSIKDLLTIVDEAHRAKNKASKRTKVVQRIASHTHQILMLTGTPLRNNEHEAAVILGLLDAQASIALSKEMGYTTQDVKDYLSHFMIRRTKVEVLPELPEKTRQRIDISDLDPTQMNIYFAALEDAQMQYQFAIKSGRSDTQARQQMQGGIEKARTALGSAKVASGAVAELIIEVVENSSAACCVVFCAHRQASDDLLTQLSKENFRAAIVDGRTSPKERAYAVEQFQKGALDVFIGGINSAGESITLTRADTVIFVELDWVPAALLQAEDRIHRVGQRNNCQIITFIAKMEDGEKNLDEMMVELINNKSARIGDVLDESTKNLIQGSMQSDILRRLIVNTVPPIRNLVVSRTESTHNEQIENTDMSAVVAEIKNKRGRPKVYVANNQPTASERSKQSVKALAAAGGKRLMLRLTPEAHEALKMIMDRSGTKQETAAINQVLIEKLNALLKAYT